MKVGNLEEGVPRTPVPSFNKNAGLTAERRSVNLIRGLPQGLEPSACMRAWWGGVLGAIINRACAVEAG